MSEETSMPAGHEFRPPVSAFAGPIAELINHGMLAPPSRPGLLATLDGFEILQILGAGGMGMVLLARDVANGTMAAIKMVRPELLTDPQIVRRFLKEAGHLQQLRHPNVVEVSAVVDRQQGPYFVMPYLDQGSLEKCIQPGVPLETGTIVDIASQVCEALQFAHQRGIIHRDLKPANILMTSDGKARLADFGLARTLFNDTLIDVNSPRCEGTGPYMSPAVAAGQAEDTRCDIYGLGALLYEMLTGEPPYKGRTTKEIRDQILAHAPVPIGQLNPKADARLAAIAEGAMARELRERYADIGDVLADLRRYREGKAPLGPRGGLRSLERGRGVPVSVWALAAVAVLAVILWVATRPRTSPVQAPIVAPMPIPQLPISPAPEPTNDIRVVTQSVVTIVTQTIASIPVTATQAVFQIPTPPAGAFEYLRTALTPYGKWLEIPPYGWCWRPTAAVTDPKWRPYAEQGRWRYTTAGWFWHSDYSWGQITFHYGRWFEHDGSWVWMPAYDWAGAWVTWREADGYLGWAPLPPAATFEPGTGLIWDGKPASDADFGLSAEAFTFVANDHFWDHDLQTAMATREDTENIFKRSTIKNGYRIEQGKFVVEGPGRDHVATVTQHDVKVESAVVRELPPGR